MLQLQNKASDKFYELILVFWQYCSERETEMRERDRHIQRQRQKISEILES